MKTNLLGRRVKFDDLHSPDNPTSCIAGGGPWEAVAGHEGEIVTVKNDAVDVLLDNGRVAADMPFLTFRVLLRDIGGFEVSEKDHRKIREFLATGNKINAIKTLRAATGASLKDAKYAIDIEESCQ